MHNVIDNPTEKDFELIDGLFVKSQKRDRHTTQQVTPIPPPIAGVTPILTGTIKRIKEGYGFITPDQGGLDIFFYHLDVKGIDFNDLLPGDRVGFCIGSNDKGLIAKEVVRLT